MSLKDMSSIPGELLGERLIEVRTLEETEKERYAIVKDEPTGEHYLQYSYIHKDFAQGGAELLFHYLLPLESDDVLEIMFADQAYRYPGTWKRPFLRTGPENDYIWFDPSPEFVGDEDEAAAEKLREKLMEFKRKGSFDQTSVAKLLEDLDKE